jgi:hypothetical protein
MPPVCPDVVRHPTDCHWRKRNGNARCRPLVRCASNILVDRLVLRGPVPRRRDRRHSRDDPIRRTKGATRQNCDRGTARVRVLE